MIVALGLGVLVAATPIDAAPSPSPPPLKTIIRVKSTPFCTVFRENVYRAVEGLRLNDVVLGAGSGYLNEMAHDAVVDPPNSKTGASFDNRAAMDRYHIGQTVHAAAENLTRARQLLNDANRFPANPQTDAERELSQMKAKLSDVADAQEQSLNILSGIYETSELNDMLSRGSGMEKALGVSDPPAYDLGQPLLAAGGPSPLPVTPAVSKTGTLSSATPAGGIARGLAMSRGLTGSLEDLVEPAIAPGLQRCK